MCVKYESISVAEAIKKASSYLSYIEQSFLINHKFGKVIEYLQDTTCNNYKQTEGLHSVRCVDH